MSPGALMTAEELLHLNLPNKRTELVRGALIVREPPGYQHGAVAMSIAASIHAFVKPQKLGRVLAAETGFILQRGPDTVRAPDVAFVRSDREPNPVPKGYAPFSPDLAVEVLSPDDRPGEILEKISDWLKAGTRLVWIVDPVRRLARVYRADGTQADLREADAFDGEDVLPGYLCRLADVL